MQAVEAIKEAFPSAVHDVQQFRGEITVYVERDAIVEVCRFCRDTSGLEYNFLSDVTGTDYYPNEPRFAVVYHLYSMIHNRALRLKVMLASDDPRVPSVTSVYPAANWQERELLDLMGITFDDHPDPRRILMPEGWDGHPLRKDYPLGYETIQFSFNYDDVEKYKPYAKE